MNDIISTKNAKSMTMDISNFYLNTPLPRSEYMKIPIDLIPPEIIQQHYHDLHNTVDHKDSSSSKSGKACMAFHKRLFAHQLLQQRLAGHGYFPVKHTQKYWRHITFVLVVDDFSVKYVHCQDADELLAILRTWYTVKVDWTAALYCGITTTWDYEHRHVTLFMPGYIDKILREIKHPRPRRPQYAPHRHIPIAYGNQPQLATEPDTSAPLPDTDVIQPARIIGKLLYYARAVDSTLCIALRTLASEQNKPTFLTKLKILHLLNFCVTNPNARLCFHASDMILQVHSDAGCNTSESNARSRSGGHLFLGIRSPDTLLRNGAILNPTNILKHVASSAADAEIGATFINCREATLIRTTLLEMGHPQPPTTVTLDNTTAVGFANQNIKQRRKKAIDMRYLLL